MPLNPIRVSALGQTLAFALLVGVLAITPMPSVDAQKGKPGVPPDSVARVTLADRLGVDGLLADEMTSDLGGSYEGAKIFGVSGDLRLDLGTLTGRTIEVTLKASHLVSETDANDVSPGTYSSDAVLYVQSMSKAPTNGDWMRTVGRIGFGSALSDHALGFRQNTSGGTTINGTSLCVRRVLGATPATWLVASSEACDSGDAAMAGLFLENQKGRTSIVPKAVYTVRFLATVVCTGGTTCPA